MTNKEFLKDFMGSTIANLEHARSEGGVKELSFEINCADLQDFNYIDIRQSDKFKDIFDKLKELSGPTLYWFEILSDTDTKQIVETFFNYKSSISSKTTPAVKTTIDYDSRTLYVGKVKGSFWGRLIQHLGFFKVNATQGLQLFYWAKDISLKLRINIYVFDNNMADIMPIAEYAFAKRLKPLLGKHK
jgi:hypothetical protein